MVHRGISRRITAQLDHHFGYTPIRVTVTIVPSPGAIDYYTPPWYSSKRNNLSRSPIGICHRHGYATYGRMPSAKQYGTSYHLPLCPLSVTRNPYLATPVSHSHQLKVTQSLSPSKSFSKHFGRSSFTSFSPSPLCRKSSFRIEGVCRIR
jgi:hypothetical protein